MSRPAICVPCHRGNHPGCRGVILVAADNTNLLGLRATSCLCECRAVQGALPFPPDGHMAIREARPEYRDAVCTCETEGFCVVCQ